MPKKSPMNGPTTHLDQMPEPAEPELDLVLPPRRRRLPDTRRSVTHKFNINGHEGYVTVGIFDDGSPGELFIKMAKQGSTLSGFVDAVGILASLALQYGVPVDALATKFEYMRFEPSGWTPNKDIPRAHSIVDYVFRWLRLNFSGTPASPPPVDVDDLGNPPPHARD